MMSYDIAHIDAEEEKNYTAESFGNRENICLNVFTVHTRWWITSVEDCEGQMTVTIF